MVGETGSGYQSAALLRIPLSEVPQPSAARVTDAELSLFSEYASVSGEPVAVRPVLQSWTTSANASTYDGVNNWSQAGGRDIGVDIGGYVDLVESVNDDWMDFDVTEAVQAALANGETHLSLMIYTSSNTNDLITFTSTEGSSSERPYLTLTWEDGSVATPTVGGESTPLRLKANWCGIRHPTLSSLTACRPSPGRTVEARQPPTGACSSKKMLPTTWLAFTYTILELTQLPLISPIVPLLQIPT